MSSREASKRQFAERLIAVMDRHGLSIAETARRVRQHLSEGEGFTDTNLVHYRQGRSMPRSKYLAALSRALEVEPSDLIADGMVPAGGKLAKKRRRRRPSTATPPAVGADRPGSPVASRAEPREALSSPAFGRGSVEIDDYGDEVQLRIDQRLPWAVALQILQAIKSYRPDEGQGISAATDAAAESP